MTNHPAVTNDHQPRAEQEFSFGLWTVGNRGCDAFGTLGAPIFLPSRLSLCWLRQEHWGQPA